MAKNVILKNESGEELHPKTEIAQVDGLQGALNGKQPSGNYLTSQSLKTINGQSIVGEGNISISAEGGTVDLSGYATKDDLSEGLAVKQDTLISGVSIKTVNGVSLLGEGDLTISGGETEVGPAYATDFEFYSKSDTAVLNELGEGMVSVTDASQTSSQPNVFFCNALEKYQARFNLETGNTSAGVLVLCYVKGTRVYGFRAMGTTEMRMQWYDYTSFSGGAHQTVTLSESWAWSSFQLLEVRWDGYNVALYDASGDEPVQIVSFDMSSLAGGDGRIIAGAAYTFFSIAARGQVLTKDFIISSNTEEEEEGGIAIDTELDVTSQNAISNSAVATRFKEDERVKYVHFSLDDFLEAFQDITTNADTYTSIFENATFGWLKEVHDLHGITVSGYVFYGNETSPTTPTFTLDDCTTKFAQEFQDNAHWLRFGFHSPQQGVSYASGRDDVAAEDYARTINALLKITGSTKCIDRIPRLQNYAGTKAALTAMRDANCGAKGFLTAADTSMTERRDSYYFTEEQNAYMFKHDYQYDPETHLHFVKTSLTSAWGYTPAVLFTDTQYANLNTHVEIFTHENQLSDGMKSFYANCFKNLKSTHKPVFWMDILH